MWPTTTENKCFVKMLWHLLGECVKATVLLVCSICTVHQFFFFSFSWSSIYAIFSTVFLHCSYSVFHCSSTVLFWLATLSFLFIYFYLFFIFKFWTVATIPSGTVAIVDIYIYIYFFFFSLLFVLFFPFIYITVHPLFLHCVCTIVALVLWFREVFIFYFLNIDIS